MKKIKIALHWQMGIALAGGAVCGLVFGGSYDIWGDFVNGIGKIFLNAINMIVIPLVFLSTVLGISTMTDSKSMGRIAAKTFGYFIATAVFAAITGVALTGLLRPGYGTKGGYIAISDAVAEVQNSEAGSLMDRIVGIVPNNIFEAFSSGNILQIIFFSLMLGFFISKLHTEKQKSINGLFESFNETIMMITNFIIGFAPIGVFAIVMNLIGEQADNMEALKNSFLNFALFILVVWIALIVMGGIILPLMVGLFARVSPIKHLKQIYSSLLVAFSTSSSYSALPLMISDAKDKFGVSNGIASFTIPLGITFNKIGTIIYECVAVVFVAQAAGVDLSLAQQVSLIGASIVTVLGAPSVPMAGVVVLAILLKAMGLPIDYIGMFMAIDMLCDMPKTMLNAYSVSCSAIIVANSEGEAIKV